MNFCGCRAAFCTFAQESMAFHKRSMTLPIGSIVVRFGVPIWDPIR